MGARVEEGCGPESTAHLLEVLTPRLVAMEATVSLVPGMQAVTLTDETDEQTRRLTLNRSVRVTLPADVDRSAFVKAVDTAEWVLGLQSFLKLHRFLGDPPNRERTDEYRMLYQRERNKEIAKARENRRRPDTPPSRRNRYGRRR